MIKSDEAEIIDGLKKRDRPTQKKFWDSFFDPLIQWVRLQAKSNEDAEEIVSDAFHRAFNGINKFSRRSSLKTWLYALARNAAIDYYRLSKNKPLVSEVGLHEEWAPSEGNYRRIIPTDDSGGEHLQSIVDPHSPATETLLAAERAQKVRHIFLKLSPEHQEVIFLRLFQGFSVSETAQILRKSPAAVKMQAKRALDNFRMLIQADPFINEKISREVLVP